MENERKFQARDIFLEIIDLPEDERQAKLDSLCANDAQLQHDVLTLLMAHEDAGGFMGSPTAPTASPSQFVAITEKAGTVIGPYKLLQQIGEGGFGTVFLAEQSKPIRRRVALKIIKLGMDTKQVIARFEAERQALALMDHPNIARVLDAGATESGRPYFVMEYVVGDSITEFADAHKLSVRERLAIFNQACAAVQHAHTKGIIHRDIKPNNILVSMTDGKPLAKVIDFGIAKATASQLTDKTLFTEHHQLIGTLEYMSPEQAEGLPDIDTRTDVYALGVLLYELLTGQTPLDAKRLRSAAYNEIRRIIKEEEPPAPSQRLSRDVFKLAAIAASRKSEPTKLSALLKGELDWIAIKALDKDRSRRYETPSALAADVQRHLDGDAVIAAPVSRGYKLRKFVKRNRGPVIAGGAVAATLLLGIAGTTVGLVIAQYNADAALNNATIAQSARDDLKDTNEKLLVRTDEVEWNSYTANLALAQMAMDNSNWPEARDRIAACPQSKRGWEWEYLSKRANSYFKEFSGELLVSPNGKIVLSWEFYSQRMKFMDTEGNQIGVSMSTEGSLVSVKLSPDGNYLSTVSLGGYKSDDHIPQKILQLWNLDGQPVGEPIPYYAWTNDVRFSHDNQRMSIILKDRTIRQLDFSGIVTRELHETDWIWEPIFSPDDSMLLVVYADQTVQLLNLDGSSVGSPMIHSGTVSIAKFSPDGQMLITATEDGRVQMWNLDGSEHGMFIQLDSRAESITISPDGQRVLIESGDHSVRMWDIDGNRVGPVLAQATHSSNSPRIRFSPDSSVVLIRKTSLIHLWNRDGSHINDFGLAGNHLSFVLISNDSSQILINSWSSEGRAGLFDMQGNLIGPLFHAPVKSSDNGIAEFVDNDTVFINGFDRQGRSKSVLMKTNSLYESDRLLHQSKHLLLAIEAEIDPDGIGKDVHEMKLQSVPFTLNTTVIATHPTGTRIVTAAADNTVRFWDPETENELASIPMDAGVTNLTFTPDGTRLVIELDDGSARILDTRSAEDQAADVQRRWAERIPAGAYLDTLMAGPTPTDDLMPAIETSPALTPLRRLAAAELLGERLGDIDNEAKRAFETITKDQTNKTEVLSAANAADLPVRVKEQVLAKAEVWEYTPPRVTEKEQLAEQTKQRRLAEAVAVARSGDAGAPAVHWEQWHSDMTEAVQTCIELAGIDSSLTLEVLRTAVNNGVQFGAEHEATFRIAAQAELTAGNFDIAVAESAFAWRARSDAGGPPNPIDRLVFALGLAQIWGDSDSAILMPPSELPGLGGESDEARARYAFDLARAIMADPQALNPDGTPWAEDRIAQSLLTEAEALIGSGK
tara:strand:+ start:13820 stop:17806 length:3987 start_codon:yes stop_codon:yes gene_type:complete